MAVHTVTFCYIIDRMSVSDRLELGFGNRDGMDEGMDGWMDKGMVCMFCDKLIENKKLSDNLGITCGKTCG